MTTDVCRRDGDREGGREGDCVRDRKEAEWKKVDKKEKGKELFPRLWYHVHHVPKKIILLKTSNIII